MVTYFNIRYLTQSAIKPNSNHTLKHIAQKKTPRPINSFCQRLRLAMETTTPEKHPSLDPPPTKRPRTNASTKEISEQSTNTNGQGNYIDDQNKILDPISTHVLERAEDWAAAYRDATPYPHGIIRDFCKQGFLGECGFFCIGIVSFPFLQQIGLIHVLFLFNGCSL